MSANRMTLENIEMEKLLPVFMRKEADLVAMSRELDPVIRQIAALNELNSVWDKIPLLPEAFLDALAHELDVQWYDPTADIEEKRRILLNCDYVHRHNGTVAAVKSLAEDIFGYAVVEEWFQYGGESFHYKLTVPSATPAQIINFRRRSSYAARASAVLEEVIVEESYEAQMGAACVPGTYYVMPPLTMLDT